MTTNREKEHYLPNPTTLARSRITRRYTNAPLNSSYHSSWCLGCPLEQTMHRSWCSILGTITKDTCCNLEKLRQNLSLRRGGLNIFLRKYQFQSGPFKLGSCQTDLKQKCITEEKSEPWKLQNFRINICMAYIGFFKVLFIIFCERPCLHFLSPWT